MSDRSAFLVGPAYDGVFFVLAPVLAVVVGALAFAIAGPGAPVDTWLGDASGLSIALRTIIHAHLVIVFARSHLNRAVFARAPTRFVVVPVVLLGAMLASHTVLLVLFGVVILWDAYHSSLQTFGLGRIYDVRAGGDARRGRLPELALCHAIYLGPMLCGPLYAVVMDAFSRPMTEAFPRFAPWAARAVAAAPTLRAIVASASLLAVAVYLVHTARAVRRGAPVAWVKQALYASTAVACVLAWGANPLGQGLFIVNLFHAVQYFALVTWTERDHLAARFSLRGRRVTLQVFALLAGVGVLYGFWLGAAPELWIPPGAAHTAALALVNTVALLHFWYDGFIWSVRRGDVAQVATAASS